MKLTIQLVTYNGEKYIPHLFASLRGQSFNDFNLLILDNNSTDKTVEYLERELKNSDLEYKLIKKEDNLGFSGGHNELFMDSDSEYVLLLNQDIYLKENCLENMVRHLDNNENVFAVSPVLLRWSIPDNFTETVDSCGLKVLRSRRVLDFMEGKDWGDVKKNLNSNILDVFGVSGAVAMYRRDALNGVVFQNNKLFDPLYHSYKEDVDLACRLNSRGHKAQVLLDTFAYHDRSGSIGEGTGDFKAANNKNRQTEYTQYHSYKNHLMNIYKNEYWQNFMLDFPFIFWYELKKFGWFLLFRYSVLKGLLEIWKDRYTLNKNRKANKNHREITWREFRKFLNLNS